MTRISIGVDPELPADQGAELARHLARQSPDILDWGFDGAELWFQCTDGSLRPALEAAASRRLAALEAFPTRVLATIKGPEQACSDVESILRQRGLVSDAGAGSVALRGPAAVLANRLDGWFAAWADTLGAEPWSFPSLVATGTLRRSGYLRDFPHQANLVCHLPGHADDIRRAAADLSKQGAVPLTASAALSPTVCYHLFVAHADRELEVGLYTATASCRCSRYEGAIEPSLERVQDFGMREVVAIGSQEEVRLFRDRLLGGLEDLLRLAGLGSWIETASDPFFADVWERGRTFQMGFDLKAEARFRPGRRADSVAIASVNHHTDHFGRAFSISLPDGSPAHSCCIGFGLERWVLAVMTQHGIDPAGWPAPLQEAS